MPDQHDRLTRSIEELSTLLLSEESVDTTLQRMADLARATVGSCDAVGVGSPRT